MANKYRALMFDLDGTLVKSESLKAMALARSAAFFGGMAAADTYKKVMGQSWQAVTNHIFTEAGISPDIDDFTLVFEGHYLSLFKKYAELTEGAETLIRNARAAGVACALVTSTKSWMVKVFLEKFGAHQWFECIVTGDDVAHHKPDPACYLKALSLLNILPGHAMAFEDTDVGIASARQAGSAVIAISHDFNIHHDLSTANSIFSSFNEFAG